MIRGRFNVVTLVLAASLGGACQSGATGGRGGSGGAGATGGGGGGSSTGSGGASGTGGGAPLDAGAGGGGTGADGGLGGVGGAAAATCDQSPTPLRATGTTLEVPLDLVYQGKPFVYGEPNAVTSTLSVIPLNVRFYLSAVELLTAGGASVPVDIVTAAGDLQPYGVFLFNAEDPAMQTLRVRAPAGSYAGLKFVLGLNGPCNWGDPAGRAFPLSADSQMTWPNLGHLFLRFEARNSSSGGDPDGGTEPEHNFPAAIHMGGDIANMISPADIVFRIAGALSVPATGGPVTKRLRVAMEQVWKGATADIDLSNAPFFAGPAEIAAGERLRRTAADLPLFVFGD